MVVFENPVLQRELTANLRMTRGFVLLFLYLAGLGAVVYLAWPVEHRLDMSRSTAAKELVDLFFLGQFLLTSLMVPSFAAGTITGEKERHTFEMLISCRLRPAAIVFGKLIASLAPLAILVFCSLPIVMLCIPLGGVHFSEVLAAYVALFFSVITFGMISVAASAFFRRTMASLTVSYLVILPLAMLGAWAWQALAEAGTARLFVILTVVPLGSVVIVIMLFLSTTRRLLYPSDIGSEGKDVVDLNTEMDRAVGMVIRSDQFPDKLFAPAKRNELMPDGANPVYDKEMRSELFSQGTLMLRIVIQVSMFLAIPLMAIFFYIVPGQAAWYASYVLLFNMLIGPVFSADRVTSERERQTLDLLLTTIVSPWQILTGKLFAGLRVSTVLTLFLVWPIVLAYVMPGGPFLHSLTNLWTMLGYIVAILVTCLTTSTVALFYSVIMRKTSFALTLSYITILALFTLPLALQYFVGQFVASDRAVEAAAAQIEGPSDAELAGRNDPFSKDVLKRREAARQKARDAAKRKRRNAKLATLTSPHAAVHSLPLDLPDDESGSGSSTSDAESSGNLLSEDEPGGWSLFGFFIFYSLVINAALLIAIVRLFHVRWRVAT